MADFITSGPIGFSGSYPGSVYSFITDAGGTASTAGGISLSGLYASANLAGISLSGSATYASPYRMYNFYGMSNCCIATEDLVCFALESDGTNLDLEDCAWVAPSPPSNRYTARGGLFGSGDGAFGFFSSDLGKANAFGQHVKLNAVGDKLIAAAPWTQGSAGHGNSDIFTWLFYNDTPGSDQWTATGTPTTSTNAGIAVPGTNDEDIWSYCGGIALSAPAGPITSDTSIRILLGHRDHGSYGGWGNEELETKLNQWIDPEGFLSARWDVAHQARLGNDAGGDAVAMSEAGNITAASNTYWYEPAYGSPSCSTWARAARVYTYIQSGVPRWDERGTVDMNMPAMGNYQPGYGGYASCDPVLSQPTGAWRDEFGASLSLNAGGDIMAVGAPSIPEYTTLEVADNAGYVKVYQYSAGNTGTMDSPNTSGYWNQLGSTISGDEAGDFCGSCVALNDSGNILTIGYPGPTDPIAWDDVLSFYRRRRRRKAASTTRGKVKVYGYDMGTPNEWELLGDVISGTPGKDEGSNFGMAVAINGSGNVLLVGSRDNDSYYGGIEGGGAAYIYLWSGGNYVDFGLPLTGISQYVFDVGGVSTMFSGGFGFAVDLNREGNMAAVGAPHWSGHAQGGTQDDGYWTGYGLVEIFEISGLP